jgi:ABC-type multidrug transport system fused ATPase/permease subunit
MEKINITNVLLNFMKENKSSIFGYLILSLAVPLSNIYLPHLYGKIISLINTKKTIDKQVKIRFACIFILWIVVQLLWATMNVIDSNFIPKLRKYVREYIVDQVIEVYRENYEEKELGGIIAEIVRLPDEVDHLFGNVRNHILPMTFLLIFSIGYFTWSNPLLGAASIVSICLYLYIAFKFSMRCVPTWSKMNTTNRTLHNEINDSLGNLLNIYTSCEEKNEKKRLDIKENEFIEYHKQTIQCAGNFRLLLNLSYIFLFFSINILSFYLYSKNIVSLDRVVSILIISLELISKMAGFVGSVDKMMYELSTISNIQELIDSLNVHKSGVEKSNGIITNVPLDGSIEFKNLSISYKGTEILKNFNNKIEKGDVTLIVGHIGSGKTSLINCIMRLIPYNGDIYINNINIKDLDIDYLRRNIIYVPQNPRLFNRTIYENISYGNNATEKQVKDMLYKYKLDIDINKNVGKYGSSVSGGQRQIIYLLRCLFKETPIVLLDEPTSSLDDEIKTFILNILQDLFKNKTVIIVSHDRDLYKYATRTINF